MSATDAAIAELTQRVEALEKISGGEDQLGANPFSFNDKGELEETLTGKLRARGIILPSGLIENGSGLGPGQELLNELIWEDEPGGPALAQLLAWHYFSLPPGLSKGARMRMAIELAGVNAGLELELDTENNTQSASISAGAGSATLINSAGESSFLQLLKEPFGPAKLELAWGEGQTIYPGPPPPALGESGAIAHGLGRQPVFVGVTLQEGFDIFYSSHLIGIKEVNETSFAVVTELTGGTWGAGANELFQWIAIG